MTTTVDVPWRPYEDEPLVTPGLLFGFAALPPVEADRLVRYLTALTEQRTVVHAAVAFNAVYFGYDLDYEGYVGGPVEFDTFPRVVTGEVGDALPVGAMVAVPTGSEPLYAEVAYKEGAHPLVGPDGDLPAWLSGAPAGARGPGQVPEVEGRPVLMERLVLDFDAFGRDFVATPAKIDRVRRQGRLLNTDGHVVRGAAYPSPTDAETGDLDYYASYLLTAGRMQLLAGPLPLLLSDDAGEAEFAAALRVAIRAVADALEAAPGLRTWRGYAFTRAGFAARLHDSGPVGGGDMASLATQLGRPSEAARARRYASPRRAPTVRYTAVGSLLRGVRDSGPLLTGLGYPLAVCHANTVIADHARRDVDDDGTLPGGVHLRLDDAWQGGGVWRASCPPGEHALTDPLLPLGLGWLGTLSPPDDATLAAADTEQDATGGELLSVSDSHVSWSVPLRLKYLLEGISPVPNPVASLLNEHGAVGSALRLQLTHEPYDLLPDEATQEVTVERAGRAARMGGVSWPLEFPVGIVVTFVWPIGGRVLRAATTLLDAPVVVDGEIYEHRFDPQVVTRGTAPGCPRRGRPQPGPLSLRDRVLRAVRLAGLLDTDGVAVLRRDLLPAEVYGAGAGQDAAAALEPVVTELLRSSVLQMERLPVQDGLVIWPLREMSVGTPQAEVLLWRPTTRPPAVVAPEVTADESRGEPGVEMNPPRGPRLSEDPQVVGSRFVLAYEVAPFLRRLPPGQMASDRARELYRTLRKRRGLSDQLPHGFTLVTGHTRHR